MGFSLISGLKGIPPGVTWRETDTNGGTGLINALSAGSLKPVSQLRSLTTLDMSGNSDPILLFHRFSVFLG